MEASVKDAAARAERKLDSEKARRIVAAMRASVARQGVARSTFDHVAQEAGVSRGLLHYYFGSKERLLVEVVRDDSAVRTGTLRERLGAAHSPDEVVAALMHQLEDFLGGDPAAQALLYEMLSVSRRSDEVRLELAELYRSWRTAVAEVLDAKARDGEIELRADAEAIASVLFALGDGVIMQLLADPDWDSAPTLEVGQRTARWLLGGE
jgi:AcrR family transcriptional regulator